MVRELTKSVVDDARRAADVIVAPFARWQPRQAPARTLLSGLNEVIASPTFLRHEVNRMG